MSKLHTYPYIFMSRYLEQKQALAEICISNYKPEMLFLTTFLYIHRTKYTINKQTYALNSQSQLYSKAVLMNTTLGLPQKPHLLNKQSCVAEYICTHTSRIYIYKLDTINAHSEALWYNASFQCSHLPHRVISVDLLFLLSFSIHVLNPTSAFNHAVFSPLEVKIALRKTLSSFNCWSSHRWHEESQYQTWTQSWVRSWNQLQEDADGQSGFSRANMHCSFPLLADAFRRGTTCLARCLRAPLTDKSSTSQSTLIVLWEFYNYWILHIENSTQTIVFHHSNPIKL